MSEPSQVPEDRDDGLEEVRASLAALRSEIGVRFAGRGGSGPAPERGGIGTRAADSDSGWWARLDRGVRDAIAGVDPLETWASLRERFAGEPGDDVVEAFDEFGRDTAALRSVQPLLDFLYDTWWRVVVRGVERVPDAPRVLFVANRSGVLPYDGLMLAHALAREHPSGHRPSFLVADWLYSQPFSQPLLSRLGGVRACSENAERLLSGDRWVVAFPEGQKGALKPWADRYRLQRFARGGFVSLAVRCRAQIVPVAIVGAEEAHPVLGRSRLLRGLIGTDLPLTPTFPLLGPLGAIPLPARWRISFGEPIALDRVDRSLAEDPLWVNRTREQVRGAVAELLDEQLALRTSIWS